MRFCMGSIAWMVLIMFSPGCSDSGSEDGPQYNQQTIEESKQRSEELKKKARRDLYVEDPDGEQKKGAHDPFSGGYKAVNNEQAEGKDEAK